MTKDEERAIKAAMKAGRLAVRITMRDEETAERAEWIRATAKAFAEKTQLLVVVCRDTKSMTPGQEVVFELFQKARPGKAGYVDPSTYGRTFAELAAGEEGMVLRKPPEGRA